MLEIRSSLAMFDSTSSLEILVDLDAVVAAVRHHDVALGGQGQALGAVQGAPQGVHVGEEWPELVKHLDPELKGTLEFL